MYKRRTPGSKRDPVKQWALPDRVFFAADRNDAADAEGVPLSVSPFKEPTSFDLAEKEPRMFTAREHREEMLTEAMSGE